MSFDDSILQILIPSFAAHFPSYNKLCKPDRRPLWKLRDGAICHIGRPPYPCCIQIEGQPLASPNPLQYKGQLNKASHTTLHVNCCPDGLEFPDC